jgi:hypothetical protein
MSWTDDFLALDTEDDSSGTVKIINFYDGHQHTTFTVEQHGDRLREKAWNWLYGEAPRLVWACNTEYDLVNLFGRWLGKMVTLQYVASGLMRGMLRDKRITFFDTLRHWPMSVEQMGRHLGMAKVWGSDEDKFDVAHCRQDTEIVWRFVHEMLTRYDGLGLTLKATLPSMALQLFTKRFYRKAYPVLPKRIVEWLRTGYYGGRVEVYRFGDIAGPVNHYDVNSLFPSVMRECVYPDPARWKQTRKTDWSREGMASVEVTMPASSYPSLPVRGGADIVYPYGRFTGTWCYPEIRQLLQDGGTVHKVHDAVEFAPLAVSPFKGYVDFCYAERMRAKAEDNALDIVWWKLAMNSLYGKFGAKPILDMIYDDEQVRLETNPPASANVVWSAYVTSHARLRLLHHLRSTTECYYTDTDSLFTPDVLPTGEELGRLKHEGTYPHVNCVGNKLYTFDAAGPHGGCKITGPHSHWKAKGVKGEAAAQDFIRTGKAVYRKPARFRESRRSLGVVANKWYEVERERHALYTKRIIHPDGTTAPWEWGQYKRMVQEV